MDQIFVPHQSVGRQLEYRSVLTLKPSRIMSNSKNLDCFAHYHTTDDRESLPQTPATLSVLLLVEVGSKRMQKIASVAANNPKQRFERNHWRPENHSGTIVLLLA